MSYTLYVASYVASSFMPERLSDPNPASNVPLIILENATHNRRCVDRDSAHVFMCGQFRSQCGVLVRSSKHANLRT